MGRIKGKHSILHHLLQTFEAFETGPALLSAYSFLVKWHSAVGAIVTTLYHGTALKTPAIFSPQDLCLIGGLTITGIDHIFSLSLLSQRGQPVIHH